jgi:diacylglycerol kinase
MTAPATQKAFTLLVFAGAASLGLVIVAGAIRIASLCLGIQTSLTVELIVSAIAAVIVGGYGGSEYLKRVKRDG